MVVLVQAPKPTARQRVPHKAAISPAAFKDLSHKTPEAALFARLKKKAAKKGSPATTVDITPGETKQAMGGRIAGNPHARPTK